MMDLALATTEAAAGLPAIPGLVAGTQVLSLAGTRPVEALRPGDRIVTRAGARTLRAVRAEAVPAARMIRIGDGALGVRRPDGAVLVMPEQSILVRDWRAMALRCRAQAMFPAERLVDGVHVRWESVTDLCRYRLEFDAPVVIYAGGLELGTTP